jgi:hypothetical protein
MIHRKTIVTFLVMLLMGLRLTSSAQDDGYVPKPRPVHHDQPKTDLMDKLYFGGNIGLQFGQGGYYGEISPMVGYKVTDKFSVGPTLTYIHYDFVYPFPIGEISNEIYGAGAFARYFVLPNVFLHAEAKFINGYWQDGERSNLYPVLIGGGYRSKFGSKASAFVMLLYDVNYDPLLSPYPSPLVYTFGFGYGF